MARELSSANQGGAAGAVVRPAIFAELDFASGATRCWSGLGQKSFADLTFEGIGSLGALSAMEEVSDLSASPLRMTLAGIDPSLLAIALTEPYQGRSARVWLGFLDLDTDMLVDDPIQIFSGVMDTMTISRDETGVVTVGCESRARQFERKTERRRTNQDQRALFPGDKGFEFVTAVQESQILWGAKVTDPAIKSASAGLPNDLGGFGDNTNFGF